MHPRQSPHRCEVPGCGKVFTYRSGLLAHIRHVHDQRHPIRCPEKSCRMQFTTNAQLQDHYEHVHKNAQPPALYDPSRMQSLPIAPMNMESCCVCCNEVLE